MATDYERLAVLLEARVADFERNIARATRNADRQFNRIQRSAETMSNRVGASAGAMATRIAGAFAAAASVRAATSLMDAATRVENALKVAGLAGEDLRQVYDALYASAQRNAAPIESLTTLYSRLALTQKELGVSQSELIGFTDKVALALRVGGTSATEASGALLQLSQALGGGVVRAEEFNSVLEGAPTIAQAVAAGLKEAGGSVANLRKLVVDGKVSSEAFFRAFEAGALTLEQKVAGSESTVSQGFVRLQNVLTDTAGKIDDATGASDKLGSGINKLADIIQAFGEVVVSAADNELFRFLGWLDDAGDKVDRLVKLMGGLPGVFTKLNQLNRDAFNGLPIGTTMREQGVQDRIDRAFEETALSASPKGGRLPAAATVKPVSVNDYAAPSSSSRGSGRRSSQDDFAREIEQIRERTAALQAAFAAQASLNPLVDDFGYTVEKASAKHELLTAAQKAGKEITPALSAEIDAAAEAYARAGAAAERLAESQNEIRERAEEAMATARDVAGGIVDGFMSVAKAADVLADSLKRIGDTLLNDVLDSIFKVNNASSGGGFLSGILGLFGGSGGFKANTTLGAVLGAVPGFASGTSFAPGGLAVVGEKGPELVNLPRGSQVIPNRLTMPALRSQASASNVNVSYSPVIDNRGASVEAVSRLEQVIARDKATFEANVITAVRKAKSEGKKGI